MALSRALILVALTATIFSTVAVAKDFVVGDDNGWTTWFDYKAWAANKVFRVGDTLSKLIQLIFSRGQVHNFKLFVIFFFFINLQHSSILLGRTM